jgi:PKD repeat protein
MRKLFALVTVIALPLAAGCTVHQDSAPTPSGPSEAALSLKMLATPDTLVQDGAQSSKVTVTAFDQSGRPIAVNVRLDVVANGTIQDFGTLSSHSVVTKTDAANPVFVTYTPPPAAIGARNTILIIGKVISSDASTANPQQVAINISPITIQAPPGSSGSAPAPTPKFTISPSSPGLNQDVFFNAATSSAAPGHVIAGYDWDFGDGNTGTGSSVTHAYTRSGTYVITLTVRDDIGQSATTTSTISVNAVSAQIVASFTFSPTNPKIGNATNTVFFDATNSFSVSGIATYAWDFGDGTTGTGMLTNHPFTKDATWVVRLTVTDGAGRTATVTQNVNVAP